MSFHRYLLLSVYLFISCPILAQQAKISIEDTTYYNSKWNRCSSYVAKYYCIPQLLNDKYAVTYRTIEHRICYKGIVRKSDKGLFYDIDPQTATREGYYEYFSPGGYKVSEGNYVNNIPSGTWKHYFDTTGKLLAVKEYDTQNISGFVTYYHEDGENVSAKGYVKGVVMKQGPRYRNEGEWQYYFNTGKIYAKVNFSAGALDGYSVFFDSASGNRIAEGRFTYGSKSGKWIYYHPKTEKREAIVNYYRGLPNGEFYIFHIPSGRLRTTGTFLNGSRMGLWSGLYDQPNLVYWQVEYRYNKGRVTYYDSANNEREVLEGNLKGNSREGQWIAYYPQSGKIKYRENYKNNKLHGEIINYSEDGMTTSELLFHDGQLNGISKYYYDGTQSKWFEIEFVGDEMLQLKAYYPSGKIKRIENNIGTSMCYNEDGTSMDCTPFRTDASFDGDIMTYIGDNLQYPEDAKFARIEGKVKVGFMVDEWGSIRDPYIIEGFDDRCDAEALRLVSQMPNWIPAKVDGVHIQTHKTLPIVFWLPPEDDEASGIAEGM